jgi:hypothetical protein
MTYSPTYSEYPDGSSHVPQNDPWNRNLEYAPTPGNFPGSPTPSRCSPSLPQRYDEATFQPTEQLQFIPLAAWKKKNKYVKQPPICVHYLVEWKVTLNNRSVHKVTERNVVLSPSNFWRDSLKERVKKVRHYKVFQN